MNEVTIKDVLSRLFTLLVGVMILVMLNMNGDVFHPLMVGQITEFTIILLLLCGTMYMAMYIGELVDKIRFSLPIQIVGSVTMLSYFTYLLIG
ncbi:hypothetical protein ABID56_001505 [Alkalibacillus flavidus]|uniref:Uncharacterized protein n=1 Tax=Alkalibacillus flavidus TaxID=546021 RepID=A0ABV2KXY9_9BACI